MFLSFQVYDWIGDITNSYKDIASVFNVTNSYEGRPLMGIKVKAGFRKYVYWLPVQCFFLFSW